MTHLPAVPEVPGATVVGDLPGARRGRRVPGRRAELAGLVALLGMTALLLPLFLRMGVWSDVTVYDLAARNILRGGVHYADVFDTNLPGMVWAHAAIRSALGWQPEAIRAVDFGIFAVVVGLLYCWMTALGASRGSATWVAFAAGAFYFQLSEWNHCQRDFWMLAPALLGLTLRRRQLVRRDRVARDRASIAATSALEGVIWGSAFWLKPFVLVPAAAAWAAGWTTVGRPARLRLGADLAGLALGGGAVLAGGSWWLWSSGAWPFFHELMVEWNPQYWDWVRSWETREFALRRWWPAAFPWSVLPLVALPLAFRALWMPRAGRRGEDAEARRIGEGLFGAFFAAWLLQAAVLQVPHDYVLNTVVLLAIPGVLVHARRTLRPEPAGILVGAFVTFAVLQHPIIDWPRLSQWPVAVAGPGTPELRDRLSLTDGRLDFGRIGWADLNRVAEFLRSRNAAPGDVLCFNDSTHPLYLLLDLEPPVRYLQFSLMLDIYAAQRRRVHAELAASRVRFMVSDLGGLQLPPETPLSAIPPRWAGRYPWQHPVVFRAGRYLVHERRGPDAPFWPTTMDRGAPGDLWLP